MSSQHTWRFSTKVSQHIEFLPSQPCVTHFVLVPNWKVQNFPICFQGPPVLFGSRGLPQTTPHSDLHALRYTLGLLQPVWGGFRAPQPASVSWVYTELLQLVVQPIRRHFENRKGPDSRLPENGLSPIFEISRMLLRVSDFTKMEILATS